jgi:serine/threonine protein kinase
MTLASGSKLGPYEIVGPLGAGGMGEVYRAKDTRLDRTVAIKVLPSHLSASPELRERFEREARSISSLNHARICTLHDVGRQGEVEYLVMEFLEGETLAERLKKGALPLKESTKIGMEVCEALEVAHRAGIVHRDLKPGNIMLTKSGAKLMDFGLAKASGVSGIGSGSAPLLSAAKTISGPSPLSPLTALPGAQETEYPVRFANGGNSLLVGQPGGRETVLTLVDLADGHRTIWKRLQAEARNGIGFVATPDLKYYAYTVPRYESELYIVENLR